MAQSFLFLKMGSCLCAQALDGVEGGVHSQGATDWIGRCLKTPKKPILDLDSDLVDALSIDRSCQLDIGLRLVSLPHGHFILG